MDGLISIRQDVEEIRSTVQEIQHTISSMNEKLDKLVRSRQF